MTVEQKPIQKTAAEIMQAKEDEKKLSEFHRTLGNIIYNAPRFLQHTDKNHSTLNLGKLEDWPPVSEPYRNFLTVDRDLYPHAYIEARLHRDESGNHMTLALMKEADNEAGQLRHITITTDSRHGRTHLDIESSAVFNPQIIGDTSHARELAYTAYTDIQETSSSPATRQLQFAGNMLGFIKDQIETQLARANDARI